MSSVGVHVYVARLRALLKDSHGRLPVTREPGYHLLVASDDVAAGRFMAVVERAHHARGGVGQTVRERWPGWRIARVTE